MLTSSGIIFSRETKNILLNISLSPAPPNLKWKCEARGGFKSRYFLTQKCVYLGLESVDLWNRRNVDNLLDSSGTLLIFVCFTLYLLLMFSVFRVFQVSSIEYCIYRCIHCVDVADSAPQRTLVAQLFFQSWAVRFGLIEGLVPFFCFEPVFISELLISFRLVADSGRSKM